MKRLVTGTLSAASVLLGASTIPQWVAKAQDCSDFIIISDGDPCTSESCELIGQTSRWCIYECTYEDICCW